MSDEDDIIVDIVTLPHNGRHITLSASPAQCAQLATRFGVIALTAYGLDIHATRKENSVNVKGHVHGHVTQNCVISLTPITTSLHCDFDIMFHPESVMNDYLSEDYADASPIPEMLEDGKANISELAAQIFSLEIPDYPRAENVHFSYTEDASRPKTPFSQLEKLKKSL